MQHFFKGDMGCSEKMDFCQFKKCVKYSEKKMYRPSGDSPRIDDKIKKTQEKELPGHRKRCMIACGILILILIWAIMQGTYIIHKLSAIQVRKPTFPIPCDYLSLSVKEDLRMLDDVITFNTGSDGNNVCEFDNISFVVEKVSERIYRQRNALGLGHRRYIACGNEDYAQNLTLYTAYFSEVQNNTDRRFDSKIQWIADRKSSFIGDSFISTDGGLRVNTTSFFYIYCIITFKNTIDRSDPELQSASPALQEIFRISIKKTQNANHGNLVPISLLDNTYTLCHEGCNHSSITTLYLGSHFLLKNNDEIFIQVSDFKRLVLSTEGNQFGMFKIE